MRKSGLASLIGISVLTVGLLAGSIVAGNSPLLGLDLQGGVEVVLRPKADQEITNDALDISSQIIRRRVDSFGVAEPDVTRQGQNVVVQLPGIDDQERAVDLVGQTGKLEFRPVLAAAQPFCREQIVNTSSSPDLLGLIVPGDSVASIQSRYSVEDISERVRLINELIDSQETVADLTQALPQCEGFNPDSNEQADDEEADATADTLTDETAENQPEEEGDSTSTTTTTVTTTTAPDGAQTDGTEGEPEPQDTEESTEEEADSMDPIYAEYIQLRQNLITEGKSAKGEDHVIFVGPDPNDSQRNIKYLLGPANVDGSALNGASAQLTGVANWIVGLDFKGGENGIDLFNETATLCNGGTTLCPTRQLAIALDGFVESAPQVNQSSFERDNVSIQGGFSESEARNLALILRYGALPLEFDDPVEAGLVRSVSATLGRDSLNAGIIAGIVGILLVAIYMIFYYRMAGAAAILSLIISAALLWIIISFLSETQGLALTLAGITGLIVSIGVSLDSNVVYFENLKDGIYNGKTLRSTTEKAFPIAFKTIFWANLATLIGAAILWWLTIGSVRGFAAILAIASILDLIATYFFLRPAVKLLANSNFIGRRPKWLIGIKGAEQTAVKGRIS